MHVKVLAKRAIAGIEAGKLLPWRQALFSAWDAVEYLDELIVRFKGNSGCDKQENVDGYGRPEVDPGPGTRDRRS
jgi:hypothetical protein